MSAYLPSILLLTSEHSQPHLLVYSTPWCSLQGALHQSFQILARLDACRGHIWHLNVLSPPWMEKRVKGKQINIMSSVHTFCRGHNQKLKSASKWTNSNAFTKHITKHMFQFKIRCNEDKYRVKCYGPSAGHTTKFWKDKQRINSLTIQEKEQVIFKEARSFYSSIEMQNFVFNSSKRLHFLFNSCFCICIVCAIYA